MKEKLPISHILISVCIAGFLYRFDFYSLSVSTPTIAHYFKVSTETVSLLYIIYLVVVSGGLLIAGRIGDKIGLKKTFGIGFLVYLIGSIAASIAWTETVLILFRVIQGIGLAFILTSAYATVSRHFSPGQRVAVFGLYSMSAQIGISLGCPVGGMLTEWFSWRGIFMTDALFGILGFITVCMCKNTESSGKAESDTNPIDYIGCVLWFFSVAIFLFALNKGQTFGWTSIMFWGLIMSSIIFGLLFVLREKRCKFPVLSVAMLGGKKGMIRFSIGMLAFAILAGNSFILPFFLKNLKLMSNSQIGFLFLIYSVTAAVISFQAKKLSPYLTPRKAVTISILTVSIGCILLFTGMKEQGLVPVMMFLLLFGIGFGLFFPNNNNLVMSSAPEGKRGVYAGIFNTFNNMGMAIGVCLFEVIFSFKTHHSDQLSHKTGSDASWMIPGFQNAYILAAAFGLTACLLSTWLMIKKRSVAKSA